MRGASGLLARGACLPTLRHLAGLNSVKTDINTRINVDTDAAWAKAAATGVANVIPTSRVDPAGAAAAAAATAPHNAAGTANWRGGPTWINEYGGEIVDLPGGSQIYPADKSKKMGGGGIEVHVHDTLGTPEMVARRVAEELAFQMRIGACGGMMGR